MALNVPRTRPNLTDPQLLQRLRGGAPSEPVRYKSMEVQAVAQQGGGWVRSFWDFIVHHVPLFLALIVIGVVLMMRHYWWRDTKQTKKQKETFAVTTKAPAQPGIGVANDVVYPDDDRVPALPLVNRSSMASAIAPVPAYDDPLMDRLSKRRATELKSRAPVIPTNDRVQAFDVEGFSGSHENFSAYFNDDLLA